MKRLLLVLLVACGSSSNPPAEPTAKATPAPAAPPASAATPPPTLPIATNAAVSAIDCAATDQAAVYCAHVKDPCCGSDVQVWVCNNARYIDWFAEQCKP